MYEAECLIRRVLEELSNPVMAGTTCTPAVLLERTKTCLDIIDNATDNFSLYNNDTSGTRVLYIAPVLCAGLCDSDPCVFLSLAISKALSSLPSLSHALGEVMLQGMATSHMASAEDGKSELYIMIMYSPYMHCTSHN